MVEESPNLELDVSSQAYSGHGTQQNVSHAFPSQNTSVLETKDAPSHEKNAIAIVGMAFRLPGASDVESLWGILESGTSMLSEIPGSRFDFRDYVAAKMPGRTMVVTTGNFVDDVDFFDNEFFGISPREAQVMDPQQRLLLHVASEALQDAGYVPNSSSNYNPDSFGVFIGAATNDYVHNLQKDLDIHHATGTLPAFLAGRISYAMGFSGPSMTLDTACSSSGVAVYQAVRSLQYGDCNAAIAGGVNVITGPDMFLGLDAGRFLSRSGQSRPFDAHADGYSRAEGCVLLVLKRLADAVQENDQIIGLVRGAEMKQSGEATSITRTHAPTQTQLLTKLLIRADVRPSEVKVIEAHAAGTKIGDTTEILAIRNVFGVDDRSQDPLYITSIKANLGHSEAASGASSIVKALLMLQHRRIPPQIEIQALNPALTVPQTLGILVPVLPVEWESQQSRYAVVNNYGAAGSNVGILLQEHRQTSGATKSPSEGKFVFGLSAPKFETLVEWRQRILEWLSHPSTQEIPNLAIAYTSTARREMYDYRITFPCDYDKATLVKSLANASIQKVNQKEPRVVFVYSGHTSQYRGMATEFYRSSPAFKTDIDDCVSIAVASGTGSSFGVLEYLLDSGGDGSLPDVCCEQLALFSFQYALARLWISWGVRPAALVGHSLGEYCALVIAGVMSLKDAVFLIITRSKLIDDHCEKQASCMLGVLMNFETLRDILRTSTEFAAIDIAGINSNNHCTASGPLDQLQGLKEKLERHHGICCRFLEVQFGYHSRFIRPILDHFTRILETITFFPPTIPIASSVEGRMMAAGEHSAITSIFYLASHSIQPVLFHQAIHSLLDHFDFEEELAIWVEIGPQQGHLALIRGDPSVPRDAMYLGSAKRNDKPPLSSLSTSLSRLYTTKLDMDWRRIFALYGKPACVRLPFMPFRGSSFWVPYKDPSLVTNCNPLLPSVSSPTLAPYDEFWTQHPTPDNQYEAQFEVPLRRFAEMIRGHRVSGVPLCPASVFVDMILGGVTAVTRFLEHHEPPTVRLEDVEFVKPLILDEEGGARVTVILRIVVSLGGYEFTLETRNAERNRSSAVHVKGRFKHGERVRLLKDYSSLLPLVNERIEKFRGSDNQKTADNDLPCDAFNTSTIYSVIFPRIVQYSSEYQALERVVLSKNKGDAWGVLKLPQETFGGEGLLHPVYVDAMVHLAGFLANLRSSNDHAFLCIGLGAFTALPEALLNGGGSPVEGAVSVYDAYCTVKETSEGGSTTLVSQTTVVRCGPGPKQVAAQVSNVRFRRVCLSSFTRSVSLAKPYFPPRHTLPVHEVKPHPCRNSTPETSTTPIDAEVSSPQAQSPNSRRLRAILSDSLRIPIKDVDEASSFDALGLDSFTSMEILHTLEPAFQVALPPNLFQGHITVASAQAFLDGLITSSRSPSLSHPSSSNHSGHLQAKSVTIAGSTPETSDEPLWPPFISQSRTPNGIRLLKSSSSGKTPLCLIHDGSGLVTAYTRLGAMDRSIWGIENPLFGCPDKGWAKLEEMVDCYASLVKSIVEETKMGSVILGGWSFGGIVAHEVYKKLRDTIHLGSVYVKGIVLIDSPCPTGGHYLSDELIEHLLSKQEVGGSTNEEDGEGNRFPQTAGGCATAQSIVSRELQKSVELLRNFFPPSTPLTVPISRPPSAEIIPVMLLLCASVVVLPPYLQIRAHSWLTSRNRLMIDTMAQHWKDFIGPIGRVAVIEIMGDHFGIFKTSQARETTKALLVACEQVDLVQPSALRTDSGPINRLVADS